MQFVQLDNNDNNNKLFPEVKRKNIYVYLHRQNLYNSGRALLGHRGLLSSVVSGREMSVVIDDKKTGKLTISKNTELINYY